MKKILFLLSIFYILFFVVSVAQAGLVPCAGPDCTFCGLITLVNNVINFILKDIALPIAALTLAWGGITIMTAGDSSSRYEEGKKIMLAAAVGVIITLGAWLIVAEILIVLSGATGGNASYFTPWQIIGGSGSLCGQ